MTIRKEDPPASDHWPAEGAKPDDDNAPDPDAMARDDLPEDERIEQQNDVA
jgi:hypothetical protein